MSARERDASIDHGERHAVVGLATHGIAALQERGDGQTREVPMARALIVLGVVVAVFAVDAIRSYSYAQCPAGSRLDYCETVGTQRVCYCKRDP